MSFGDRIHGISLARRLTSRFVAVATTLVLLTVVPLYFALAKEMESRGDQMLLARALTISKLLAGPLIDYDGLDREISEDLEGPRQLYVRIGGPAEMGMHETPNLPNVFPLASADLSSGDRQYGGSVSEGRRFRTFVMKVPLFSQAAGGLATIEIAMDDSLNVEILNRYIQFAGMAVALALAISIVVGWYTVRTQLRPLRRLVTAVASVDHLTLAHRVAPDGLPTELKEFATELNRMLARLETAYQAQRRYADDVAHELRTPINRIQLGAEVALREARTPENYRDALESTLEECMHLGNMVKSLLFLARVENGQARLLLVSIGVAERLEKIRVFFEASAMDAGIDLTVECDGQLSIMADATLFQRAISNVVANSLAHTPRGGRVSMRADPENSGIVVEIADSGEGIAPEYQDRIFDRFYRVDPARTTVNDRVGLGLAITKSIVELHQGRVALQSAPGTGTRVFLHFPATRNAAANA